MTYFGNSSSGQEKDREQGKTNAPRVQDMNDGCHERCDNTNRSQRLPRVRPINQSSDCRNGYDGFHDWRLFMLYSDTEMWLKERELPKQLVWGCVMPGSILVLA